MLDIKSARKMFDKVDFLLYEMSYIKECLEDKEERQTITDAEREQLKLINHLIHIVD